MNWKFFTAVLFLNLLIAPNVSSQSENLPVVLWHGMGDTCCFPFSLGAIKKLIKSHTNNTYVKSLQIGGSFIQDYRSGFFIHPNKQIKDACAQIENDPNLANGYNAIGFSQGGQFLRAVAQRCPSPQMQNLITFGGQHQGIFGLPECPSLSVTSCEYIRQLLNHAAYESWIQKELVQATYWHNPLNEEKYKSASSFLADINNEVTINEDYITNLQSLQRFIMVKFENDTIVQPKETQWFEFYKAGQDREIQPLVDNEIYSQLGLQTMDLAGKLIFLQTEGDHLQFTDSWFIQNIVPYLNN